MINFFPSRAGGSLSGLLIAAVVFITVFAEAGAPMAGNAGGAFGPAGFSEAKDTCDVRIRSAHSAATSRSTAFITMTVRSR